MVYGEGVIGESMTRKWFAKSENGNFDIDNMLCNRRPEFDEGHLKGFLKEESCQTSRELAKKMNCNQKSDFQSSSFNGICRKIGSLGAF